MEENNETEEEEATKRPDETTEAEGKKPTGTQTQRRHHDPNNQETSRSISVQKDPEMHDRIRTVEQDASVNVGEQPKDSCDQRRLDEETKTEKQKQRAQRRRHGLYNQGATCYLNSVLQVLFMTTEIHGSLVPQKHTDQQLRNIFEGLKKRTCSTENITTTFGIKNVYEQRDAAECLEKILHRISTNASEVFKGELMDTITCSEGHSIIEEKNPFWTLPLSLKDARDTTNSVESSFERVFQAITYTGKNKVYCYDCKNDTDTTSSCKMKKAPQILILLLKRFQLDKNTRSHFKSHCCVKVPCELQLKEKEKAKEEEAKEAAKEEKEEEAKKEEAKEAEKKEAEEAKKEAEEAKTYELYGMVDHMGSIRGGHYTATVRSEDNTWYECNDSHVKIKHQLFAEDGTFSSRSVYLLAYRASELKVSSKMSQNEEDEEDNTERNSNDKSEGLKSIKPSKRPLDGETEEQGAPKKLRETTSPSRTDDAAERLDETNKVDDQMQTDDEETRQMEHNDVATECQRPAEFKEEQGEYIDPEELKGHKEPKRNTDEEEPQRTTEMEHSAEDEGQMRKDGKEERLQAREEGDAEKVETDTSINNHTTVSEVKSSEDREAQQDEEGCTQENSKSEELNETREEDASVNVGEQLKDSCDQHLAKTETEEQRVSELKMSCKMRQNEAKPNEETTTEREGRGAAESQVFPETNKPDDPTQDDVEPKGSSLKRDAEDEDKEQIRQNGTYELQETSDEALSSQTGGEQGDEETGNIVLDEVGSETESEREPLNTEKPRDEKDDKAGEPECERFKLHDKDGETSQIRDMTTDENCRTASEVENSVHVEAQDNQDVNRDRTHSSFTQENTSNKSEKVKNNEVDDASVSGKEQSKNLDEGRQNISCWQRIRTICSCTCRNNAEDEEQIRLQARGEQGDAETEMIVLDEVRSETESEREPLNTEKPRDEKDDKAGEPECERFKLHDKDGETSQIRDMTTDENCRTASEVENSVHVEAQDNQDVNRDRTHSSFTQENTSNKSEKVKNNEVDDASVSGKEQSKNLDEGRQNISCWQRIRTICSCTCRNNAEDEEQIRLQARGEQGDAETEMIVLDEVRSETESEREPLNTEKPRDEKDDKAGEPECERFKLHDKDGETSQIRDMTTDENCRTASEVENSVHVEAQDNQDVNRDRTHSSFTQENTSNKSEKVKNNEVDDASVSGKEQSKNLDEGRQNISCWQRIRTICSCTCRNNAEDEEQIRLQARGEQGDAETEMIVLDEVRSETEPEREPLNREKLRDEKDDKAGEPECERIESHDNSVSVEAQDNLNINPDRTHSCIT